MEIEPLALNLDEYFKNLEAFIRDELSRPQADVLTFDLLDSEKSKTNKWIALKERQRLMKVGLIMQTAIGTFPGFHDLKIGHESGLDILSNTREIAIELKNRTNTDNASSKKANLDKLAKFKKQNPTYRCIYATINEDTE